MVQAIGLTYIIPQCELILQWIEWNSWSVIMKVEGEMHRECGMCLQRQIDGQHFGIDLRLEIMKLTELNRELRMTALLYGYIGRGLTDLTGFWWELSFCSRFYRQSSLAVNANFSLPSRRALWGVSKFLPIKILKLGTDFFPFEEWEIRIQFLQ